jgi:hypothetical protein
MVRTDTTDVPQRFYVVANWFEELKTRAAQSR